jgi:hypothetical protein
VKKRIFFALNRTVVLRVKFRPKIGKIRQIWTGWQVCIPFLTRSEKTIEMVIDHCLAWTNYSKGQVNISIGLIGYFFDWPLFNDLHKQVPSHRCQDLLWHHTRSRVIFSHPFNKLCLSHQGATKNQNQSTIWSLPRKVHKEPKKWPQEGDFKDAKKFVIKCKISENAHLNTGNYTLNYRTFKNWNSNVSLITNLQKLE